MLYILGICSAVLGVIEYLSADDKADQIKGLLLIIMAIIITHQISNYIYYPYKTIRRISYDVEF